MELERIGPKIFPDSSRLTQRPFLPAGASHNGHLSRVIRIARQIHAMSDSDRSRLLEEELASQRDPSRALSTWRAHYEMVSASGDGFPRLSAEGSDLLGAYVTQSYAYEGVALTNPSMFPLEEPTNGEQPFVISARAIGEGHISSITFLRGSVHADGSLAVNERAEVPSTGRRVGARLERRFFERRLAELGVSLELRDRILDDLPPSFAPTELDANLRALESADLDRGSASEAIHLAHMLASSNYEVQFEPDEDISSRVISPGAPVESNGIEDARFVKFVSEDGSPSFYATYTAYDGRQILPQLIQSDDLRSFRMTTLSGTMAQNKGFALFPRKVGGEYVMLSRQDNESIFVMRSDDIRDWSNMQLVKRPEFGWEMAQIGNCGSPMETAAGWLVITHGVGPMRSYSLGAILLDLDDPSIMIGQTSQPILTPSPNEQIGHVPNVVYSCGSMVYEGRIFVPYGFADFGIGFATGTVDQILDAMTWSTSRA